MPIGYAVFAFALGALAGAVTRRTQRAVALTIVVFLAIRFGVAVGCVLGSSHNGSEPIRSSGRADRGGWPATGSSAAAVPASVPCSPQTTRIKGGQMVCGSDLADECREEVGPGAYNFEIIQPADRCWTFQAIEPSIFLVLASAALARTVLWVRRRLAYPRQQRALGRGGRPARRLHAALST